MQGVCNYGSVLQAFATQELFKEMGVLPVIINYYRKDIQPDRLHTAWANGNPVKYLAMIPTINRWNKVFGGFRSKWLNLSKDVYVTEADFSTYPIEADYYCTGSDQVWNSKWNLGIERPLYLSFVPDDKIKFSFAASFGQDRLSEEEVFATKELIKKYSFLSAREKTGVDILEKQYGRDDACLVLDPTLCMDADFWRKYKTSPLKKDEKYILIYNLNRSKEFDEYALKLSRATGYKLIRFCTRYDQLFRVGKSMLVPEVFDFIGLIDSAQFVLTDSFHATAFSMNMNTTPICVYPNEFGGRLQSFLELMGAESQHITDYDDIDVINRGVDFNKINHILDKNRGYAREYLKKVLTYRDEG